MRAASIIAAVAVLAATALSLVPEAAAYHEYLRIAAVALAAILLLTIVFGGGRPPAAAEQPAVEEARPAPVPDVPDNQADAEVVSFLAVLQERGRLVDFLMEEITAYSDAQVGAAARVVHEGCRAALREHVGIRPVRDESEGSGVSVPEGYAAEDYRLIGKIGGSAPFSGTLVHRGWKAEWVRLPRLLRREDDRLPAIAPAEVEIR